MSKFDLNKFAFPSDPSDARAAIVFMARTSETAERYDDMRKFMSKLVDHLVDEDYKLTVEERNLLSVAYKNVIGARRASWRSLTAEGVEAAATIDLYRENIEEELKVICKEILNMLEHKLIPHATEEAKVFYLKMAADYYRYLAECVATTEHQENAEKFYKAAFEIASEELQPTHPIRLGLALNYSVCMFEIKKDKENACKLAKNAFDDAISKLDKLDESDYKDSTLIMQLLRDNLTLWTSTSGGNDGDEEEN